MYRIYFIVGPTLAAWYFTHRWCFDAVIDKLSATDDLQIYSGTIRLSGTRSHSQGVVGGTSIRSVYEGIQFEWCPAPFCVKSFNPKIDYAFYAAFPVRFANNSIL